MIADHQAATPDPLTGPQELVIGRPVAARGRRWVRRRVAVLTVVGGLLGVAVLVLALLGYPHGGPDRAGATATDPTRTPAHGTASTSAGTPSTASSPHVPGARGTRDGARPAGDADTARPDRRSVSASPGDPTRTGSAGENGADSGDRAAAARGTIPDVVGRDADAAEAAVRAAGFGSVGRVYRADPGTRDTVLATDPAAGTRAVRDATTTVTLTVSSGPSTVTVPDVIGRGAADARSMLRAAGLAVVQRVTSGPSTAPAGSVEAVSPAVGTRVPAGSSVTITVAADPVVLPDLRGRPVGEAERTLTGLGFAVVRRLQAGDAPAGTVLAQTPAAGGVARGATVTLVVAQPSGGGTTPSPSPGRGPGSSPSSTSR
jgi:beta-lactam-binding protein with PASTA domain